MRRHIVCVDDPLKETDAWNQNVDFKLGDIVSLDIENATYDVVTIHFVLHEIDESLRQEKVNALSQKLKSDGRMFVREPLSVRHGMPPDEVRALVSSAGLYEWRFGVFKPRFG